MLCAASWVSRSLVSTLGASTFVPSGRTHTALPYSSSLSPHPSMQISAAARTSEFAMAFPGPRGIRFCVSVDWKGCWNILPLPSGHRYPGGRYRWKSEPRGKGIDPGRKVAMGTGIRRRSPGSKGIPFGFDRGWIPLGNPDRIGFEPHAMGKQNPSEWRWTHTHVRISRADGTPDSRRRGGQPRGSKDLEGG
eukprot:scaffold525_cov307-Pavlova_lutheri.AAC.8